MSARRRSTSATSSSKRSLPAGVSATPRASTSPNLTRSAPVETPPSASLNVRGSDSARNEVWRNSTSGPSHLGGPWISGIISIPRACMDSYRSSMSSTRGVRWLMCVVVTPPMSAATPEMRSSSVYQARSTGSGDSANDAAASSRNRSASVADSSPCSTATSARSRSSAGKSSRAARKLCSRPARSGSKKRRSSGTSIEVNTRKGFAASSARSRGRKAVETTGTGAGAASRRS